MSVSQMLREQSRMTIHPGLLDSEDFCRFLDIRIPAAVQDLTEQEISIASLRTAQYACIVEFVSDSSTIWRDLRFQYNPAMGTEKFLRGMGMNEKQYYEYCTFVPREITAIEYKMITIGDLVRTLPLPLLVPIFKRIRVN